MASPICNAERLLWISCAAALGPRADGGFGPFVSLHFCPQNSDVEEGKGRLAPVVAAPYWPLATARLMTGAIVSWFILRSLQYFVSSQTDTLFFPLLALHPQQHSAIFSLVTSEASLMMCSQLAEDFLDTFAGVKALPQYTQTLSRSRISCSSRLGIFQPFTI